MTSCGHGVPVMDFVAIVEAPIEEGATTTLKEIEKVLALMHEAPKGYKPG